MNILKKRLLITLSVLVGVGVIHVTVFWYVGLHDTTHKADVIVILANTVNPDGSMSNRLQSRLDKGLELYRANYAPLIVVSGGLGKEGYNEAVVMQQYLLAQKVPAENIVVDDTGINTLTTAQHTKDILAKRNLHSAVVVTQFFHILRSEYAFHKVGIPEVYRAHANFYEIRDLYATARDIIAFYDYLLFR